MEKVAFITGAGGYLASAIAVTFAKSGIKTALCDINEETLNKTLKKVIENGGEGKYYTANVACADETESAINQAFKDFGRLDILVNVAGGSARIAGPDAKSALLINQDIKTIETVIGVNLLGTIWACRAAGKIMAEQGTGGRIINFASAVGVNGLSYATEYAASKGGVISLTKSLAKELGAYKITVNAVAPGVVCRPEVDTSTESGHHYAYETNFLGEMCTDEDIANLTEFLASDKAKFITGQTYVCDGGRSLAMKGSE